MDSLQRLGCLMITTPAPSAPTRGLEAITNLPPLWLYSQELAANTWMRIRSIDDPLSWSGVPNLRVITDNTKIGHQRYWQCIAEKVGVSNNGSDNRHWSSLWGDLSISLETLPNTAQYVGYTDGSKFPYGTGAAWSLCEGDFAIASNRYHLGFSSRAFCTFAIG